MSMNLQAYKNHLEQPWGKIYYDILFKQLEDIKGQRILDFGSGFGIVANFLAEKNEVVAVEPDGAMIAERRQDFSYEQLQGSLDLLHKLPDQSFDAIVCHNVLEYVPDPKACLQECSRLLREGGQLSLVKHHEVGRILHTAVFEADADKALRLLAGENYQTHSMGEAKLYQLDDLIADLPLQTEHYQGLRIFYGLQDNSFKTQPGWAQQMLVVEKAVYDRSPYRDIAAFQHFWLKKTAALVEGR
ncbi:class I SAM-dependent methyltransferase [Streptococcus sp. DD11]|uniref:class I SAM-dependent methyltransferase n=1 Tax=Streptococcus sp. DD11 TaxID=1777879 RepID=UPI0010086200|nr:class I SAM-dependent methyltransferase [Streptococcus sp. DD11]